MSVHKTIRDSLNDLALTQTVFNRAGDLREAGIGVAESVPATKLVQHTVGDLIDKLEKAAAEFPELLIDDSEL